ncbi:MAG: hypothetical protein R2778_13560 [Saprospiraceae bacterium]
MQRNFMPAWSLAFYIYTYKFRLGKFKRASPTAYSPAPQASSSVIGLVIFKVFPPLSQAPFNSTGSIFTPTNPGSLHIIAFIHIGKGKDFSEFAEFIFTRQSLGNLIM